MSARDTGLASREPFGDPLIEVIAAVRGDRPWIAAALVVAATMHGVVGWGLPRLLVPRAPRLASAPTEVVDIDVPKLPAAPPPPTAPPEPPSPAPPSKREVAPSRETSLPSPARAASVLTKQVSPDDPVDLTGSFVTGSASTYAGGTTTSTGTSARAAVGGAPSGAPTGRGTENSAPSAHPGPDRSRPPSIAGGSEWNCPFPAEADAAQIDRAVVTIKVEVDASGRVKTATVVRDPGNGFGREARRCALDKVWSAALDHDGARVAGMVTVNVRFER